MGAAGGLGDDLVDDAQSQLVGRRDLHRLGGLVLAVLVLPEDGRAPLGRDHRVGRVLQHEHPVAHPQRQRAAAPPLAGDGDDDRHLQHGHLDQVAGDRLGLAALLGVEPGIGAGGVDEGEDRAAELLRQLHHPQRLAVPLGARLAEVAVDPLLGVAPLLMADHRHAPAAELREPGHDGGIVPERAVAVDLDPVGHQRLDVVEGVRAVLMAGHQGLLPAVEAAVDLRGGLAQGAAQALQLLLLSLGESFQLLDAAPELVQGLVELGVGDCHDARQTSMKRGAKVNAGPGHECPGYAPNEKPAEAGSIPGRRD